MLRSLLLGAGTILSIEAPVVVCSGDALAWTAMPALSAPLQGAFK